MTLVSNVIVALGTIPKGLVRGGWKISNLEDEGDHLDYSIIKIGTNTKKSPGVLRRLAIAQTPVKDHLITLMRKTPKE